MFQRPSLFFALHLLVVVEYAYSDCFAGPTVQALIESVAPFETSELVIRATLVDQLVNISCPLNVYTTDYVDTTEGFGVLKVEEVFRGDIAVNDTVTFVYSTDTGYRQQMLPPLTAAAQTSDGILVFLSQTFVSCANDTDTSPEGVFGINECDFGTGVPYDGWSSVSDEDKEYLRSLDIPAETAQPVSSPAISTGDATPPASQPTTSTLSPTPLPASSAAAIGTSLTLFLMVAVQF